MISFPTLNLPFRSRKMSNRRFLHLVWSKGHGLYALSRMNTSSLFYPSAAAAAEAAENKMNGSRKLRVIESIIPLPEPKVHCGPFRSTTLSDAGGWIDLFALLGESKILCSSAGGYTSIYDTQMHSFMSMPRRNAPKGPKCVATYITRTAAHASVDFDLDPESDHSVFAMKPHGPHTDSLYVLDMDQGNPCSFEVLAHYPLSHWFWLELPPPPFFSDPHYKAPSNIAFAVVDGKRICVSSGTATYSFDTVSVEWLKDGDWVLPFRSKAEYVPELRLWVGLLAGGGGGDLCALDLSGVGTGSCDAPPTVQHIGLLDDEVPEDWVLRNRTLVNLGSGRFCVASFFDNGDAKVCPQVLVFTGVQVARCGSHPRGEGQGLRMIKHKTKCLMADSIEHVL